MGGRGGVCVDVQECVSICEFVCGCVEWARVYVCGCVQCVCMAVCVCEREYNVCLSMHT